MVPRIYLDTLAGTYRSVSVVKEIISDCKESSDVYVRLIFEAGKIGFLFEIDEVDNILEFLKSVDRYISDIYKGQTVDVTLLQTAYAQLDSVKIQEKLEQQLNLSH